MLQTHTYTHTHREREREREREKERERVNEFSRNSVTQLVTQLTFILHKLNYNVLKNYCTKALIRYVVWFKDPEDLFIPVTIRQKHLLQCLPQKKNVLPLIHLEYKVKLPNHDFVVSFEPKLVLLVISDVKLLKLFKRKLFCTMVQSI